MATQTRTAEILARQTKEGTPKPGGVQRGTDLILPPERVANRLRHFAEEVFDTTPESHISRFMKVLLGDAGAGQVRKRITVTRLQQALQGTHFFDLDRFYGALFGLRRNSYERYLTNPYADTAVGEVWQEIRGKDTSFRSRIEQFGRAITYGATPTGIELAAEAVLSVDCDILESYYQADAGFRTYDELEGTPYSDMEGVSYEELQGDPLPRLESQRRLFTVRPKRLITLEEAYNLSRVLDRLKPADSRYEVESQGIPVHLPAALRGFYADSNYWEVMRYVAKDQTGETAIEQTRPPFSEYQGEAWSYNGVVAGASAYTLDSEGAPTSMPTQRVVFGDGSFYDYAAAAAVMPQRYVQAGRSVSDGILVSHPYSAVRAGLATTGQSTLARTTLAPVYADRIPIDVLAETLRQSQFPTFQETLAQRYWVTPDRDGSDTTAEVIEVRLATPRLVNYLTFEVSHYPANISAEVYEEGLGRWLPVFTDSINDSLPSSVNPSVLDPQIGHPLHSFPGHWQRYSKRISPIITGRVRLVLRRNNGFTPKLAVFGRGGDPRYIPYSLAVRSFDVGYRITKREDVPVGAVGSTTDILGSLVEFRLREEPAANLLEGGVPSTIEVPGQDAILTLTRMGTTHDRQGFKFSPSTPTGGTYTLTYDGQTTAPIAYNANAAAIEAALEALSNLAPGDVSVIEQLPFANFVVIFEGAMAALPQPTITGNGTSLTGPGSPYTIHLEWHEAGGDPIANPGYEAGSTYTVTFRGETTAPIDGFATAGEVQAALEALPSIGVGGVDVVSEDDDVFQPWDGGVMTLRFRGALGDEAVEAADLSGDGSGFIPGEFTAYDPYSFESAVLVAGRPVSTAPGPLVLGTGWRSEPQPVNYAVVNLHIDARDEYGVGTTIDRFYLDPTHSGAHITIYWTNDEPTGTDPDDSFFNDATWTPIPRDYVLSKGYIHIPPTRARFFNFEFTNLTAEVYEAFLPITRTVKLFPRAVVETFRSRQRGTGREAMPEGLAAAVDVNAPGRFRDNVFNRLTERTATSYPTEAIYATDPASTDRLRALDYHLGLSTWHQENDAPRFAFAQQHHYETVEVNHTTKTAFFVGLRSIEAFRLDFEADDDTQVYVEHFWDGYNLAAGMTWEMNPNMLFSLTPGAVATSKVLASRNGVRALQFATQQTEAAQIIPDADFVDPALASYTWDHPDHWQKVGDAFVAYLENEHSVLVKRHVTAPDRAVGADPGPFRGLVQPVFAFREHTVEDSESVAATEGGVVSTNIIPAQETRIHAAARVILDTDLTNPLKLQIVAGNNGQVLAEKEITGHKGEMLEWYVSHDMGIVYVPPAPPTRYEFRSLVAPPFSPILDPEAEEVDPDSGPPLEPDDSHVQVRLVQSGKSDDQWRLDNLSLFDEGIVWEFSVNGGGDWYPARGIRNNQHGVLVFPAPGNQLTWRARGQRQHMAINMLKIRPWYIGAKNSRLSGTMRGPNVSTYDHDPPIDADPDFITWTIPIPRGWWYANKRYPQALPVEGAPNVTPYARFYARTANDDLGAHEGARTWEALGEEEWEDVEDETWAELGSSGIHDDAEGQVFASRQGVDHMALGPTTDSLTRAVSLTRATTESAPATDAAIAATAPPSDPMVRPPVQPPD